MEADERLRAVVNVGVGAGGDLHPVLKEAAHGRSQASWTEAD
jgi:hypothetical protein